MASWVISECGLRPLPRIYPKPRTGASSSFPTNNINLSRIPRTDLGISFCNNKERNWALRVSAPLRIQTVGQEEESETRDNGGEFFDPGAAPPFKLSDIRAAIPKHCWVKNPWRSMSYVVRDVAIVLGLAAVAAYFNNWIVWPLYWFAQGTMFWALFVLGHDCGHGSFSNDHKLNSVVGHILHSSILVPYHGWRISHRTHHQNHGHVENDESWHPLPENIYKKLDFATKKLRFTLPFPLLAYPFYLWSRSPGKKGSHFDPNSDLFVPSEEKDVITSTLCWTAMAALLVGLSFVMGPLQVLKLYGIPYWVFVMWLDLVTYLHHHGHDDKLPWYRGQEISKVAREYGAEPVGVFVDDNADTILKASDAADLELVQLHGNGSRDAFPVLVREKRLIYALHANEEGGLLNSISDEESSLVDWILVDSAKGGSGKGFNWAQFKLPSIRSKHGWLLAGGIQPENVCEALSALKPDGVDVSSGICGQDGVIKDESRILSFMNAVKSVCRSGTG